MAISLESSTSFHEIQPKIFSNVNNNPSIYRKKVTVIIPAYNEENRILPVLNEVCSFISKNMLSWEVVVSIDGTDRTEVIAKEMMGKFSFLNYTKGTGRSGKGGAIKRALDFCSGDYLILMDADGAIPFNEIIKYLHLLDRYDMINFDRYKKRENRIPRLRRLVSRGYNLYIKLLFNLDINDTQCGYKIMRTLDTKEVFNKLTITNGFFYSPFFVYLKKMKVKTVEVSVSYQHEEGSKFSVSSMILGGFVSALAFRLRISPLWKFVPNRIVKLYYKKFRWI